MILGVAGLAGVAALSKLASAGPLDPPPGPVTPTGVSLEDLSNRIARGAEGIAEPRTPVPAGFNPTITNPGSYYLTSSVSSVSIESDRVQLDLNGFTLTGGSNAAINIEASDVTIRNGRIDTTGSSADAIRFSQDAVTLRRNVLLEDLDIATFGYVARAFGAGSTTTADRVTLRRVRFLAGFGGPQTGGVILGNGCAAVDCVLLGGRSGIQLGDDAFVSDCECSGVTDFAGISVGNRSLVRGVRVDGVSFAEGIKVGADSLVADSLVSRCTTGISAGARSTIDRCSVSGCTGFGVRAGQRLRLVNSVIQSTTGTGVKVDSFDSTIADCSINISSGLGIDLIGPAMIERCHMANNSGAIRTDALTRIHACHLDFNGATGISATSTSVGGMDIRDCTITRHTTGVNLAVGAGNAVTRCMFSGNSTAISVPAGGVAPTVNAANANSATNPLVNLVL